MHIPFETIIMSEWDSDNFFKEGWQKPPSFGSRKGKEKADRKTSEARPTKTSVAPAMKQVEVTRHAMKNKLNSIQWLLDKLLSEEMSDRVHLTIEDANGDTDDFYMIAHPTDVEDGIPEKFEQQLVDLTGEHDGVYGLTGEVDPKFFDEFCSTAISLSKKMNSYMSYIITLEGEVVTYDISLRRKYYDLKDIGVNLDEPSYRKFYLLDDKHLANHNSLVSSAYRALKKASDDCEPISGISQIFFGLYHEKSKTFVLIKMPV